MYIPGKIQEAQYESDACRLYHLCVVDGADAKPDAAPTIEISDPDGDVIISAASMTMQPVTTSGWLDFDGQTAEFQVGAVLTGGTSGATATIAEVRSSSNTGSLRLVDIDGTFQDDETISDDGDYSGSAAADGACWSALYYYDADLSTQDLGELYIGEIEFDVSSVSFRRVLYFDIVVYPYEPIITSQLIDELHPDWAGMRPEQMHDWTAAIKRGHARVAKHIRDIGKRPALMVVREQLEPLELAAVEAEITARTIRADDETRRYYADRYAQAWSDAGRFVYASGEDADEDIPDSDEMILQTRFTR